MKKQKKELSGGNWMDTYGDMVTLLLCFFVMLYSMSTIDQAKWEKIVLSFNPDAKQVSQVVANEDLAPGEDPVKGSIEQQEIDQQFDELYNALKKAVEEQNLQDQVELTQGEGYTFITFRDKVFFDGESEVIRDDGKVILDAVAQVLGQANPAIKEIRVLGHTAQGDPNRPNNVERDRTLSADRSTNVVIYLQRTGTVDASKYVQISYGQFRPVATNDTEEGRSQNRRVELLITKSDDVEQGLDDYYSIYNK